MNTHHINLQIFLEAKCKDFGYDLIYDSPFRVEKDGVTVLTVHEDQIKREITAVSSAGSFSFTYEGVPGFVDLRNVWGLIR